MPYVMDSCAPTTWKIFDIPFPPPLLLSLCSSSFLAHYCREGGGASGLEPSVSPEGHVSALLPHFVLLQGGLTMLPTSGEARTAALVYHIARLLLPWCLLVNAVFVYYFPGGSDSQLIGHYQKLSSSKLPRQLTIRAASCLLWPAVTVPFIWQPAASFDNDTLCVSGGGSRVLLLGMNGGG